MKRSNNIPSGTFAAMLSFSILLGSSASAQEAATKDVKPGANIVPVVNQA